MLFRQFFELEEWTFANCQPYQRTFWTKFLATTRYTSLIITTILYTYGIARREIYVLWFGVVLSFDTLLSIGLQYAFRAPVPVATCPALFSPYGFPSGEIEHTTLFVTFIFLYCFIWRTQYFRAWHVALLVFYQCVSVFAALHLNYHTALQIVFGAYVGAVNALIAQLVFFYLIFPHLKGILDWRVITLFQYRDTLCAEEVEGEQPADANKTPTLSDL